MSSDLRVEVWAERRGGWKLKQVLSAPMHSEGFSFVNTYTVRFILPKGRLRFMYQLRPGSEYRCLNIKWGNTPTAGYEAEFRPGTIRLEQS